MAAEGELSFRTEPEGLTLQGVLGTRRVLAYRNFLTVLTKGSEEAAKGELTHGEISEYGGNVLGKVGSDWRFSCDIDEGNMPGMFEFVFRVTYKGDEPTDANMAVEVIIEDEGEPRWMIPGVFYKHGRDADCSAQLPRFDTTPDEHDPFASNEWAFRIDRAASPGVFCWTAHAMTCLMTNEQINGHVTGVYLRSTGDSTVLGLNFPYREQPANLAPCNGDTDQPTIDWLHIEPEDQVYIRFNMYFCDSQLHRYNTLLQERYYQDSRNHHCRPWVDARHACDLAAEGLLRWHYDPAQSLLADTCAFDRNFATGPKHVVSPEMHTAGLNGAHCAFPLLWYGRKFDRQDCVDAAVAVLDRIASGIAPAGVFWSKCGADGSWAGGSEDVVRAADAAETAIFLARAFNYEKEAGHARPEWEKAVKSNLDFATSVQNDDGSFGSAYDAAKGEITDSRGAGGLLWVATLAEGYRTLRNEDYLQAADLAAEYYSNFVNDDYITGASTENPAVPSSRDGYNALIAYATLHGQTSNSKWLNLAKRAADWLLSFRCCYNVAFHPETLLFHYDFRTRGADVASAGGGYLYGYGLVCHPELVKLGDLLGDGYYLERAHDHLQSFRQFIARYDGDFGARRGMAPAGFYQTDAAGPKGCQQQLSHACCQGLVLYANLWDIEYGD